MRFTRVRHNAISALGGFAHKLQSRTTINAVRRVRPARASCGNRGKGSEEGGQDGSGQAITMGNADLIRLPIWSAIAHADCPGPSIDADAM